MSRPADHAYDAAEPIAVVGMGMRFPGGSHSSEQFWDMLSKGRSAFGKIPKERFNADGYYHPDSARAGSINIKGSYFLSEDPVQFDAPFFSMTANEANGTDPQQRLLLEVAYETLENAGIPMHSVIGSQTSVHVGCFTKDFESVGGRDPYGGPFYAATGNGQSMLSNRVSWFFDLRGPSMTIDTACSSSLYALHLACQSLKLGESKMALVGGTNLIYDPSYMRDMVTMTFFSPDGMCHSFDHRANGYARGDGIGGMLLKTLKQALADGDTIRAVIRNSGLNQDGKTPGITMPSPRAQADLIQSTYAAAGLSLDQTAYFEAHGTGTAIGDPSELSALGATFGKTRTPENPIYAASVKTNIGHLEGCAGLAGVIKTILAVERGEIPPLADFEKANPRLKLDEWRVALPERLTPWPTQGLRRASVNSFGYGGANAHVIIDDAYHYLEEHGLKGNHQTTISVRHPDWDDDEDSGVGSTPASEDMALSEHGRRLFVFSSSEQAGLQRLSAAFSTFIDDKLQAEKRLGSMASVYWPTFMTDLAFTLGSRRSTLDHRTFAVATSASELSKQLQSDIPKLRRVAKNNNIIFIFTGQGAQWPTMGKELIGHDVYRASLERAQVALEALGCSWSVVGELAATEESTHIDSPDYSQPLCTALQLALVDLLRSWGVQPKAVVGHSSGEIGAAYAAGALTHEDAMKVAYLRGVYSADVNRRQPHIRGAMMAVGLSEEGVKPYLSQVALDAVVVACVNAPSSVTLSGDEEAIDHLEMLLKEDRIFARKLRVQTAYHSPHMRIIAEDYLNAMSDLGTPKEESTGVVMFSSVTTMPVAPRDLDASYWVKNMLSPVKFSDAVTALITQPSAGKGRRRAAMSYSAMVECGPADALKGPLKQILVATDERLVTSVPYTSILTRGVDAEVAAMQAAGKLWGNGLHVDLSMVNFQAPPAPTSHKVLVNLPPYPWNHSKIYSHSSAWGRNYRFREKPRTDLLGMHLENQDPTEPRWHNYIRLAEQPWMSDHKVQQMVLYPGAGLIVMAIEAARELVDPDRSFKAIEARDVLFERGLVVPSVDAAVETAIHLRPQIPKPTFKTTYDFRIFSRNDGEAWLENCSGSVSILYHGDIDEAESESFAWQSETTLLGDIRKRATKSLAPRTFYKLFDKKMNLQYGPLHQNVTECIVGTGEGHGTVTVPDTRAVMPSQFEYPHLIHPSTLDSVFHMQALGYLHTLTGHESLVPISIASVYVAADVATAPGSQLKGYSKGTQSELGDSIGDIVLSDEQWLSPKVIVRGFLSRDLSRTDPGSTMLDTAARKCTDIQWVELDQAGATTSNTEAQGEASEPSTAQTVLGKVVLLHDTDPSEKIPILLEKLAKRLEHLGCASHTATLADLEQSGILTNAGQTIISLLEAEEPAIAKWTAQAFDQFKLLTSRAEAMLWITRGGDAVTEKDLQFSTSTGLLRTIRVEKPQLKLPHLDLSPNSELTADATIDKVMQAFKLSILNDADAIEQEFVEMNEKLFVPRLSTQENFHAELGGQGDRKTLTGQSLGSITRPLRATTDADCKSLLWTDDDELGGPLAESDVEILTSAVSVDPGEVSAGSVLGHDAVGVVLQVGSSVTRFAPGDSVVVCSPHSLRTHIRSPEGLVRHVPESISPVVAAMMPTALCTAQAALIDSARLQPGESILICATLGNVEQAMILLAKHIGAKVFAAAGTPDHKRLLVEQYGLPENHIVRPIGSSAFLSDVKDITEGTGVDVFVHALSENIQELSLRCLADFGRFISVGSHKVAPGAAVAANNVMFASVNIEHARQASGSRLAGIFTRVWDQASEGFLAQIAPKRSYSCSDAEQGLEYLRGETCTGSIVLKLDPEDVVSVLPPKPTKLELDPAATYILSGGLGGIGRSIAEMMFAAGARNISFLSRSGARAAEAKQLLSSLQERGCNAQAYACDITEAAQVDEFIKTCSERGEKIKGLVQCAMVLRDSMFDNMTFEQWTEATRPKIQGTWNLHRFLPKDVDFFVILSSMAGVIGNPGQANYSAAGTYQDALSRHRRANGLAAMTVDLGIVSDVGYIAENADQFERLEYLENLFISERDLHAILSAAMLGHTMDGVPVPAQLVTGVGKELLQDGSIGSAMASDLKYTNLQESNGDESGAGNASEDEAIKMDLKKAETLRDASRVVENVLAAQLAKALTMEKDEVDMDKPMHSYGVDSLVAVEVKNMVFRKLKADISVFDILSPLSLVKLALKILGKSKFVSADIATLAQQEAAD